MRRRHTMPFGTELSDEGATFSLWAPTARSVALDLDGQRIDLPQEADGWRRLLVPEAQAGARYRYVVDDALVVPDPVSRHQPDGIHGPSLIVDPQAYDWQDEDWRGRPWEEAVLYEVHVGTATPEGTFAALADKLPVLADLGITAVELMPVAQCPGLRNWGYDGALPFAPHHAYGTPDDLKRLVERAHGLGLMVLLDVVYNHFGPSGNYLHAYAASFFTDRHETPWGQAIDFESGSSGPVRDFFIHNALYWLEEFHFDGLRLDAVHAITDGSDPHILDDIARTVRKSFPDRHVHLVLENDANEARYLERSQGAARRYTAQWDDDLHHAWHVVLTGESAGYYADYGDIPLQALGRALAEGFVYQGEASRFRKGTRRGEPSRHLPPTAFVAFLQNHDQIGNRAFGERLTVLVPEQRLAAARAALLLSPQVPMLFMGEEWASPSPFLYFVDYAEEPDIARAVRDGRRREFAEGAGFSDPARAETIPDPNAEDTFARSRIDWTEREQPPHADILAQVQRLLSLRRDHVLPLLRSGFRDARWDLPTAYCLDVSWHFEAGTLRFILNVGDAPLTLSGVDHSTAIFMSEPARQEGDECILPAWCAVFFASLRP